MKDNFSKIREMDAREIVLWMNPDVDTPEEIVEKADGDWTFVECPNPECQCEIDAEVADTLGTDDPAEAQRDLIRRAVGVHGTIRCPECDEPLYGARGLRTGGEL
jgi:hypothetical protein